VTSPQAAQPLPPLPLVPSAAFVVVWSSGYIAGPYGIEAVNPLWLVALRFLVAALVVAAIARVARGPLRTADGGRLDRSTLLRLAGVGFTLNGGLFAIMYVAFDEGFDPTLAAMLHALSPVLTALLAGVLLRERVTRLQAVGFAVGVAGVVTVLGPDVGQAGSPLGLALGIVSLFAISLGTLGQRWVAHGPDPLWSAAVQFGVSVPPVVLLALLLEGTDVVVGDPVQGAVALAWLAGVNSVVGLVLLGVLVRVGGAGAAASLFFLMPPVTAVMAYAVLGEGLSAREVVGLLLGVVGVAVATRSAVLARRAALLAPVPES